MKPLPTDFGSFSKRLVTGALLISTSLTCSIVLTSCETKPPQDQQSNGEEQTLLKALASQKAISGSGSPELEAPLEKVASYYELQNRYDVAENYLRELVVSRPANWNWERLSMALTEQGKYSDAIAAMKKSVEIIEKKGNKESTAAVYIRYAKLLEKAGKNDEALPLRDKAHELAPNVKNSTLHFHKKLPVTDTTAPAETDSSN